jgi:hypothetical protein
MKSETYIYKCMQHHICVIHAISETNEMNISGDVS